MIQHAFTGAYTNQVAAQNQGINTITSGIKDTAMTAMGIAGFSGALGTGAVAKASKYGLAGRVGGIGGAIMLSTMEEKKASAEAREEQKQMFSSEEVGSTIKAQLGDNPINRPALKKLNTVFETLTNAKSQGIINEQGNLDMKQVGNVIARADEKDLQKTFDELVSKAKTSEELETLNNVWDKLSAARSKKKEQDLIVDVVSKITKEDK